MKVTLTLCDVCQDQGKPAKTYQIRRMDDGATASTDLCDEHAEPLEALLGAAHTPAPRAKTKAATRTTTKRPRGIKVKSIEDIEKEKAASG